MPVYTGTLGKSVISAGECVIVHFADGAIVEFKSLAEAHGFIKFYHTNATAGKTNPGKVYQLTNGVWVIQMQS